MNPRAGYELMYKELIFSAVVSCWHSVLWPMIVSPCDPLYGSCGTEALLGSHRSDARGLAGLFPVLCESSVKSWPAVELFGKTSHM